MESTPLRARPKVLKGLVKYEGKYYRAVGVTEYALTLVNVDDDNEIIVTSRNNNNLEWIEKE